MTKKLLQSIVLGTALLLTGISPVSLADRYSRHAERRGGEDGGLSMDEAVQQVRRETGGRVLSADRIREDGRTVYRIKVLSPSGHVRVRTIDAQRDR